MKSLDCLIDALRSLKSNTMRSVLTTLGIIIGVGAVIVMVSVGNGTKEEINAMIDRMGANLMMVMPGRSFAENSLANAVRVAAINGGRHVAPCFAGDTLYAWSEVLETAELPGRADLGALRLRTVAAKDRGCADFPLKDVEGKYDPSVLLDLDYWVLLPR